MAFTTDTRVRDDLSRFYGEYLTTYVSEHEQVRAHLFRNGETVTARILFPTGLDPSNVTDRFDDQLQEYATSHGIVDPLHFVYHL